MRTSNNLAATGLIRQYVNEALLSGLIPQLERSHDRVLEKWSVLDDYYSHRDLLSESRFLIAENLIDKAWGGFKGLASYVGKKVIDGGAWVVKQGKKFGSKTIEVLKKVGDGLKGIIIKCIKSLPGGEYVLEFLSEVAGNIKEKIAKMQAAIGKKVKEFMDSAKKKIVDFFFEYVINDQVLKKDVLGALGLKESMVRRLAKKGRLIVEEDDKEGNEALEMVAKKLGLPSTDDSKEVLDALNGKGEDPQATLRDAGAKVIDKLINMWLKLVEQNPKRYHEPFYKSGFFEVFGTGYGLASASILGILGASSLSWEELVKYVTGLVRGFKGGTGLPDGSKTNRAGAFLFLGNEGNDYDATLFKNFIGGIIRGSNIEVITRVLMGDATKIPDLVKRVLGTIVNGIKEKINSVTPEAVSSYTGDPIDDETEEEVTEAIGDYVTDMFGLSS